MRDLGSQDACVQLQELAIRHLETDANAQGELSGEFLMEAFADYRISHGTYDFRLLRVLSATSYVVLTHAVFDGAVRQIIQDVKRNGGGRSAQWKSTTRDGKTMPALDELIVNLMPSASKPLRAAPERELFNYYRVLRIANAHPGAKSDRRASEAYDAIDASKFRQDYSLLAPNPPDKIAYDDFMLYTRSIKYYARLLNEACA
jgi:hypothetical protein